MASFDLYVPKLKMHEGGFVHHPDDPGGATSCGVTLATYRRFYGNHKSIDDLKNISYSEWYRIMKSYWDKCMGDDIQNQSIAEVFIDWYINSGIWAIKHVQRLFNLIDDGIVGRKTLAALNQKNTRTVFERIKNRRIQYYERLGKKQPKFVKGWLNRVNSFTYQEGL